MSDGYRPIITDEEWRAHEAARWAETTDRRLKSITSGAWDLEANDRIASLSTLPSLDSYAGNELRDQAGPAVATALPPEAAPEAAPATDWATQADARIAILGSDFLPAGGVGEDPDRLSAPLPTRPQRPVDQEGAPGEQHAYDAVSNPGFQGDLPDFAALDRITSEPPQAQVTGHRFADAVGNASRWLQEHVTFDPFKRFVGAAGPRAEETLHRMADETNPLAGGLDVMNLVTAVPMAGALHGLGLPDAPLAPGVERDTPLLGGLTNPTEALSQILGPGELVGAGRGLGRLATGAVRHLGTGALDDALRNLPKYGEAVLAGLSDELAPAASASGVIDIPNRVPRPQMRESLALFEPSTGRFITPLEGELEHEDMLARLQVQGVQLREPLHLSFTKDPNMVTIAPEGDPGPTRWRAMAEKAMDRLASGFGEQADDWLVHVVDPQGYNWLGRVGDGIDGLHVPGRPQTMGSFGVIDGAGDASAAGRGLDWGTDTSAGAFGRALVDPAKRGALLRGVLGDAPTGTDLLTSRVGAVAGGVGGAAQIDENDTPRDAVGKILTGVALGATAGRSAARGAQALGRIHASGINATRAALRELGPDELGAVATAVQRVARPTAEGEIETPNALKKAGELVQRYRYTNALYDAGGAVADVVSNLINIPRLGWRTGVGALHELGVATADKATTFSELDGMAKGLMAGGWSGLREAADALIMGGNPVAAEQSRELVKGPAGAVLTLGPRLRVAADVLAQHLGREMGSQMMAFRQATREGLKYGTPNYAKRVEQLRSGIRSLLDEGVEQGGTAVRRAREVTDVLGGQSRTVSDVPVEDLAREAEAIAKRLVFQQTPGELAQKIGGLKGDQGVGWLVLFYRTLANIAGESVTATPGIGAAGIGRDVARAAAGEGPYAAGKGVMSGTRLTRSSTAAVLPASQRAADQELGWLAMMGGGMLVANNLMTDGGPPDPATRKKMWDEGWRPFAFKVGKTYVPVTRVLGPLALPLVMGASSVGHHRRTGQFDAELLANVAADVGGEWFQQSGLRGFGDLFDLAGSFREGGAGVRKALERYAAGQLGTLIPGPLRVAESYSDQVVRDPHSLWERLKAQIPGAAGTVEPRRADTGEVVRRPLRVGVEFSQEQRGVRQYLGSSSAELDQRITDAITAVDRFESKPGEYPRPTAEQRRLAARFDDRENPRFVELRRGELARQRRSRVAAGNTSPLNDLSAALGSLPVFGASAASQAGR